jgi:acetylornithine deacetylase/succinyl-diaminopimelate desuccinylase-like protein
MMYGHLDKQPYGPGWEEGLSPIDPVIRGEFMYGRGSADDGYSAFACLLAVKAVQQSGGKLPRIVLTLETEEESGSPNLLALLKEAEPLIGTPDVMLCMDSGALDYEQLWLTSSLRGIAIVDVTVEAGKIGYHSGEVGGVVPETFRIVRQLLDRLDDSVTGLVIPELHVEVPEVKRKEAQFIAEKYGKKVYNKFPMHEGVEYVDQDNIEQLYLNKVWSPNMAITGADDLPATKIAGNVLRPKTTVRVSMRLSPVFDAHKANDIIVEKLTTNVPYNAKVTIKGGHAGSGWCQKDLDAWFQTSFEEASHKYFEGLPLGTFGEGGSIPFLKELEKKYPETQIVAFGVCGPESNIHGPNEKINLTYVRKIIKTLALIVSTCGKQ